MKIKITNSSIKKIEKRLLKVVKSQYNGKGLYCCVDKVEITQMEGFILEYTIRYGREGSENNFQNIDTIYVGNQNLNFVAGQFFQCMLDRES